MVLRANVEQINIYDIFSTVLCVCNLHFLFNEELRITYAKATTKNFVYQKKKSTKPIAWSKTILYLLTT